ncbi:MAG: NADH:flavin oxidoreductase [Planctomycetaceae bacterium]
MMQTERQRELAPSPIFEPLRFSSGLVVKNRLFRSNVSGRFDNYNGSGTETRIRWEESFARGGVGGIISSFTPVSVPGRILPNYAMIDDDDKTPFWRALGKRVHAAGATAFPNDPTQTQECRFIMQLSHSGRQQDIGGIENRYDLALSSTSRPDYFHGILCRAMTQSEIHRVVRQFGDGARRAQDAGLDGVELHGANGYLITQFLSSAINDRRDGYGGSVRNRARFVLEILEAIRSRTDRFHVQMKINAEDFDNALYPWRKRGNRLDETLEICELLKSQAGIDAIHVSSGSIFPHPRNPPGDFPLREVNDWYDSMISSGIRTRFNAFIFRRPVLGPLFRWWWNKRRGTAFEHIKDGVNLDFAATIKEAVGDDVKVIVTGGFQHRQVIESAVATGKVDAVSIARPLIANRDLPKLFHAGMDWPDAAFVPLERWPIESRHPCTYCNKCLMNDVENPLGCYDETRYREYGEKSYERMMEKVMEVFPTWEERPETCDAPGDQERVPAA